MGLLSYFPGGGSKAGPQLIIIAVATPANLPSSAPDGTIACFTAITIGTVYRDTIPSNPATGDIAAFVSPGNSGGVLDGCISQFNGAHWIILAFKVRKMGVWVNPLKITLYNRGILAAKYEIYPPAVDKIIFTADQINLYRPTEGDMLYLVFYFYADITYMATQNIYVSEYLYPACGLYTTLYPYEPNWVDGDFRQSVGLLTYNIASKTGVKGIQIGINTTGAISLSVNEIYLTMS